MAFLFESPPKTPEDLPCMKYYPIFDRRWQTSLKEQEKSDSSGGKIKRKPRSKSASTRSKPYARKQLFKADEQYFLDCGQKDFDSKRCKICNMLFTIGEIDDEKTHEVYHDMFINSLKYRDWKNEDIVASFEDGRILRVVPSSPHYMRKKVDELFTIADIELNINMDLESSFKPSSAIFIYIASKKASKRIAGFVFVEKINCANWLLSEDPFTASTEEVPAECGVARIWIHPNFRRKGIATRLLDTVRHSFFPDKLVDKDKLAFSDPTLAGKDFAKKYMHSDRFLIYMYKHIVS